MLPSKLYLKAPLFCTLLLDSNCSSLTLKQWEDIITKLKTDVKEITIVNSDFFPQQQLIEIAELINIAEIPFHLESHTNWEQPQSFLDSFMRFPYLSSFRVEYPPQTENMLRNIQFTIHCGIETYTYTFLKEEMVAGMRDMVVTASSIGVKGSVFFVTPDSLISESSLKKGLRILEELEGEGYNIIFEGCLPLCFYPHHWDGCCGGTFSSVIDSNGDVRVCRYNKEFAGNLLKNTIEKIWAGKSIRDFKTSFPKQCKKCTFLEECPRGCKEMLNLFIRSPFTENLPEDVIDVSLDSSLYPYPQFIIREESFGAILLKKRSVIPVNHKGYELAKIIDGFTSLGEFSKKHGEDSLFFLYALYMKHFIKFNKVKFDTEKETTEIKEYTAKTDDEEHEAKVPSIYELPIAEDDKLALFYVMNGVKPVCRLMLSILARRKIELFCREKALYLFVSPYKLRAKTDNVQQNYIHKLEYVSINDENEDDFLFAYITKDFSLLKEVMNNTNNDDMQGKLLGYPSCCNDFFAQQKNIDADSNLDFTANVPWSLKTAPFFTNIAIRCFGMNIIHHFPCNLFCEESIKLGKEYLALMYKYNSKLADTYVKELSSFVVYTREGVFYTPLYKIKNNNLVEYNGLKTSNHDSKLYEKLSKSNELTINGPHTILLGEELIDNKDMRVFLFGIE